MSDTIKKLTDLFARFPTVGNRTASRFIFYLLRLSEEEINELTNAIANLKNNVALCVFCFNPYEGQGNLCEICSNSSRNRQLLCVVEKENDLLSIEHAKRYRGLYFILGGTVLSLKKNNKDGLRIQALQQRIKNPEQFGLPSIQFSEVIVATNPTPEGKATSVLVERALKELSQFPNLKMTHLAKGLPVGGELEYADEETLESAFDGRK